MKGSPDKLTFVFDGPPAYWSEAPNPQRLMLFCRTLDELRGQVEAEGSPQVKMQKLVSGYRRSVSSLGAVARKFFRCLNTC